MIEGEFGAVRVWEDRHANGPRLAVQDLKTGHVGYLDALELESLAWTTHEALSVIVDPSLERWTGEGDSADEE